MNAPAFTTYPMRIARLQENYDIGTSREQVPAELREKMDAECLVVSNKKLRFLFQNAMESYSADTKNEKIREYNIEHATKTEKKARSFYRFL
ncbi:hypothetical protein STCU_00695 [Strigomonas culicis]|uniref:Uncharacterized protein n=1 Tax=Strigomonas culicis TaxID=28005 RepID=S9WJY2_9TRYP|nr:hypothetical protein STCU_00695 [Strigomonas culicis]|eukprot:EPY36220.1 hypothetical protein STCU_00695 [Strigomonas culicis]